MNHLPDHGELLPTRSERQKLEAAQEVIDFGERTGIIIVKVIDIDDAFVGLKPFVEIPRGWCPPYGR